MFYIVEIQTSEAGTGTYLVTKKADQNEAEADFHRVCSAAAISDVYKHGAVLISEDAATIRHEIYKHPKKETQAAGQEG